MVAEGRLELCINRALHEMPVVARSFTLRKGCQVDLKGGGPRSYERDLTMWIGCIALGADFSARLVCFTDHTKAEHHLDLQYAEVYFDGFAAFWERLSARADEISLAIPAFDVEARKIENPIYGSW